MRPNRRNFLLTGADLLVAALAAPSIANAGRRLVFGGGPAGGTFQIVADAIQDFDPVKKGTDFTVGAQPSAGSLENRRNVHEGRASFGVVYSGHLYQGFIGRLRGETDKYDNVLAAASLYGAPAQLVVRKGSGIEGVKDLIGKRVGVGNAGSGAFANCELFFSHLGLWNKIRRNTIGYNDAAAAFGNDQLDAFWLFTAFPSGAVTMAAQSNEIKLLDLEKDAVTSGFYEKYPYFSKVTVPAGTYKGVDTDVHSFEDSALWVANADVPDDVVYKLLSVIFSDEGLAHMRARSDTFKEMTVESGVKGIVTPMHPGAKNFWRDKGVLKLAPE